MSAFRLAQFAYVLASAAAAYAGGSGLQCTDRSDARCGARASAHQDAVKGGRALLQFTDGKSGMVTDTDGKGSVITDTDTDDKSSFMDSIDTKDFQESEMFKEERSKLIIAMGKRAGATVFERASAFQQELNDFRSNLNLCLNRMRAAATPSNNELDNLIQGFIDKQAASQDKCPAQLEQVKTQMGALHTHIQDLSSQVNATEVQIGATTQELEQVHQDMTSVTDYKTEELGKCGKQMEEDKGMWDVLKQEMAEMQMIANPSNVGPAQSSLLQQGEPSKKSPQPPAQISASEIGSARLLSAQTKALVQELMSCSAHPNSAAAPGKVALNQIGTDNATTPSPSGVSCRTGLSAELSVGHRTTDISLPRTLQNGEYSTYKCQDVNPQWHGSVWMFCRDGKIAPDSKYCYSGAAGGPETCAAQKVHLEKTYVKAYVELSRLLAQYEEVTQSTACEDATVQTSTQRMQPLQRRVSALSGSLTSLNDQLQSFRPRMEDANNAETRLRTHIKEVSGKCAAMDETVESLDKVRDSIHALEHCPSDVKPFFRIPVWAGSWVSAKFDVEGQTDKEIDDAMNALCQTLSQQGGSQIRAAETSEIAERTVDGAPLLNTATVPLMGACPGCHGDEDGKSGVTHKSGYARVCWDPNVKLDEQDRRTDCSTGKKAVMCVTEGGQFQMR